MKSSNFLKQFQPLLMVDCRKMRTFIAIWKSNIFLSSHMSLTEASYLAKHKVKDLRKGEMYSSGPPCWLRW